MSPDPDFFDRVEAALTRRPDTVWVGEDLALLGWGEAARLDPGVGGDRFERAHRLLESTEAPLALASFTFDEETAGSVLIVPETILRIDPAGATVLAGNAGDLPAPSSTLPVPRGRIVEEPDPYWLRSAASALRAIADGEVEKVVLSRTATAHFPSPIPLAEVVAALVRNERGSRTFLVDGLVGSSPELLVSLREGAVESVSLAGSVHRHDPEAGRVLGSEKTLREHSLAADSVEEALIPYCPRLTRSPVTVAGYGEITHLATYFRGETLPGTVVGELLASLHPTAAVAGTPTKSALELIREMEGHDRGRYAGPVGWLGRDGDGELAIALRCGLVEGNRVTLYAGAGLVAGSDPGVELEETRIKLRPMLRALGLT